MASGANAERSGASGTSRALDRHAASRLAMTTAL
jgi:hypothetical protein